jgi:small-conductance mechanosensitive channel
MAGTVMVYMRPFKLGDRVRIADTVGDVIEKTLLVTRVRTNKNEEISIPNALVLGSHIVNYSNSAREGKLILHTTVTIGYDVDWRRVHEALISAATDLEAIQEDPTPFVLQKSLDDYSVTYELNAYTDDAQRMSRSYSELHQSIQDRCSEAGIEILSPLYAATRDGTPSTIPLGATKSIEVEA